MGLMSGTGPLGRKPAGVFNPEQTLYLEPTPKRLRVVVGGETIADSRAAFMLHEQGLQPVYYFPVADVRSEFLEPSDRHTRCPKKGEASYWTIRAGDSVVEAGAWYYPEPLASAPWLRDLVAFYFDRMDHWYEEDEEIHVHPRDPYHRVDVVASDRRHAGVPRWLGPGRVRARAGAVRDRVAGALVHPARGRGRGLGAVRHDHALPVQRRCRLLLGRRRQGSRVVLRAARWTRSAGSRGSLCFFNEKVDLELDGELAERPETPWSHAVRSDAPAQAASR